MELECSSHLPDFPQASLPQAPTPVHLCFAVNAVVLGWQHYFIVRETGDRPVGGQHRPVSGEDRLVRGQVPRCRSLRKLGGVET